MLRVIYTRVAELRQDLDGQLAHGGLLVKAEPHGVTLHDTLVLEIVLPDGTSLRGEGLVLHCHAGHGVAVTVSPQQVATLRERLPGLQDAPQPGPVRHECDPGPQAAPPPPPPLDHKPAAEARHGEQMNNAEKIQLALHGNKDDRLAILRDKNRALHPYVLKNPQITTDEVLGIAKSALASPELLGQIGERREWVQQPTLALVLCRNPKTPQGTGLKALQHVALSDLRQLAKGGCPPHITDAARKRVIKP